VNRKSIFTIAFVLLLLVFDQVFKIGVKASMYLGEEIPILGSWFKLHFIENEGMAFGMVFWNGYWGKMLLTSFRLLASAGIGWIIYKMIKQNVAWGVLICVSLVFTGAVGNIFDCVFYGKIFSASHYFGPVATFFPQQGGYAPIFQGKVVDMLQLDLFTIHFPQWMPFWGGSDMNFFPAVFNLADSCITIGLFILILFYRKPLSAFIDALEKRKLKSEIITADIDGKNTENQAD
jgi:signal peptidase II